MERPNVTISVFMPGILVIVLRSIMQGPDQ